MLIDTHCHLDFPEFDRDREEVIERARHCGIDTIINIGSSLQGSREAVALAEKYDSIYAAVGIHPHEADSFNPAQEAELRKLAGRGKVVAFGEIGLDYFKNYSKTENQQRMFGALLNVAKEKGLPLIIHSRDAGQDVISGLRQAMPVKAVIHCFSGDENFLQECLSLGFFISFTCNITYKKADKLRELLKRVPIERLLLETDSPFLAPEGKRGMRNEPVNVKILAEQISLIRGISFEQVAKNTTENARRFFNLP